VHSVLVRKLSVWHAGSPFLSVSVSARQPIRPLRPCLSVRPSGRPSVCPARGLFRHQGTALHIARMSLMSACIVVPHAAIVAPDADAWHKRRPCGEGGGDVRSLQSGTRSQHDAGAVLPHPRARHDARQCAALCPGEAASDLPRAGEPTRIPRHGEHVVAQSPMAAPASSQDMRAWHLSFGPDASPHLSVCLSGPVERH
jgi:hypothetical protein